MRVDDIITTIESIQKTRRQLKVWMNPDALIIPIGDINYSVWMKIDQAKLNLQDYYSILGEHIADATENWDRDELLAVFGLLEE